MDKVPAQEKEEKLEPRTLKILLRWEAPSRLFKKRSREYFSTIFAIAALLAIILVFIQEWLLIATIVALVFVVYVMGTIPPENVEHQITNRGVHTGEKSYRWAQMDRFWFEEKTGQKILFLETKLRYPKVLLLLLGGTDQGKVKEILTGYLPEEKPEKTWIDNASRWLSEKIPLEE